VDFRIRNQPRRVRIELNPREVDSSIGIEVEVRDAHEAERKAKPLFDLGCIVPQDFHNPSPDRPKPDQSYADGFLIRLPAHSVPLSCSLLGGDARDSCPVNPDSDFSFSKEAPNSAHRLADAVLILN
jgi:hypothetical protein